MLSHSARVPYWKAFRLKAHRLLGEGYQSARKRIQEQEWGEDEITEFIHEHAETRLDELQSASLAYLNFKIQEQRPVNQPGIHGKNRQKIDIVIRCPNKKQALLFAFEAKRLRTNGFGVGKYVGAEGMGCFLNDEYAGNMPEAGMIAYYQNENFGYWEKQLKERLDVTLHPISIERAIATELKSSHTRKSGNEIELYHIFLDCRPK